MAENLFSFSVGKDRPVSAAATRNQAKAQNSEAEVLCRQLVEALRLIPEGVRNGGVVKTREWLGIVNDANKAIADKRPKPEVLQQHLARLRSFK